MGAQAGFSAAQLRGIAELTILCAFLVFQIRVLQQPLLWNHLVGFTIVLAGVLVVLGGPFTQEVAQRAVVGQLSSVSATTRSDTELLGATGASSQSTAWTSPT